MKTEHKVAIIIVYLTTIIGLSFIIERYFGSKPAICFFAIAVGVPFLIGGLWLSAYVMDTIDTLFKEEAEQKRKINELYEEHKKNKGK